MTVGLGMGMKEWDTTRGIVMGYLDAEYSVIWVEDLVEVKGGSDQRGGERQNA